MQVNPVVRISIQKSFSALKIGWLSQEALEIKTWIIHFVENIFSLTKVAMFGSGAIQTILFFKWDAATVYEENIVILE